MCSVETTQCPRSGKLCNATRLNLSRKVIADKFATSLNGDGNSRANLALIANFIQTQTCSHCRMSAALTLLRQIELPRAVSPDQAEMAIDNLMILGRYLKDSTSSKEA